VLRIQGAHVCVINLRNVTLTEPTEASDSATGSNLNCTMQPSSTAQRPRQIGEAGSICVNVFKRGDHNLNYDFSPKPKVLLILSRFLPDQTSPDYPIDSSVRVRGLFSLQIFPQVSGLE
jgi:hypothetical protein